MYNCYVTSTISVRCRGSFSYSYSYNDNYNCVLDNRFHVNPTLLAPSHCCACCANSSICNVPINPTLLYGQRQSTLIQYSPSRKLILGGLNQGFSRLPMCDYDRNVRYQKSYNFKERGSVGRRGKLGKGRYGCNVDDAEVILSLLTEEVDEECLGVRKRNVGGERNVRRVRSDERFKEVSDSSCKRRVKANRSGAHKGTSKREKESLKLQFREEDTKQKEDRRQEKRETFIRGESSGTRIRSEGSGCSSYYSLPSSGEFEDDSKAQVKSDEFTGELSSGHKVDYRDSRYDREVTEEVDGSYADNHEVVSKKGDKSNNLYAEASGVDYDLRKKSEKKLDAELIEQTESWKKSRLADFRESGYGKSHSALKQYDDRRETSRSVENTDTTRQQYRNTGQQVGGIPESEMKYKQFAEIPDIHDTVGETNSGSKSQYSGREEGLLAGSSFVQDNARKYGFVTKEETYGRNSQKFEYSSKSQESLKSQEIINREDLILRGQSEAKMKNLEDATFVPKLGDHSKEQYRRSGQQMTTQSGSIGEFQQWTTISNTQNINIQNTSISQKKSDRRIMILPKESQESAETPYQEADRRTGSKKEPVGITSQTDAEVGTSSGRRMSNKQNSSGLKQDEKTKYDVMDERVMHRGAPGEAQRLTKMTSSPDDIAEEAISSSSSLKLGTVHQVGVSPSNNTSSKATARVRMRDEPTGGSHRKNSESGSSTLYMPALEGSTDTQHEVLGEARSGTHDNLLKFLSHEDMIGSAARLQQSSTEFVGEFVDKLRHEKSTSDVHQERGNQQGQSHAQKGHDLHSSGDSEQKDHDPMPVSQGSGAKGPSDEMWDVTDPSIPESRKTESVPEAATTTENSVVKRTGRSMWSVISDIVRLRWAPNSETNNSRSGGKSSSNQSTSSDAWFSGHEHDENNDENITQGRGTVGKELTSVGQEGLGVMHAHNQGELSGSMKLKDKMKHVEMPVPVSSVSESVSRLTPKGNMSPTDEKTVAKRRQGTSRIMEPELTLPIPAISMKTSPSVLHEISEPELSVPLPARSLRSPIVHGVAEPESLHPLPSTHMRRSTPVVEEMSEAGEADASGSGMALSRQPGSTSVTEISISEGKPGGMKQKKLQRTTQVLKDRFDEWEEAHMLETEQRKNDEMFMREALLEAKKAADVWEVPVGAVLVQHGKIIARGHNLVEELRDSTAHAEMICIREASNMLRSWRLSETTLYVTLEPCPMCAGAILQARIDTIVWGAPNKLLGADGSWIRLFPSGGEGHSSSEPTVEAPAPVHPFHPNVKLRRGVLASECADAMQQFFQLRRKKRDEKPELPTPATPPSCLPISSRPSKLLTKMHDAFHVMFCL